MHDYYKVFNHLTQYALEQVGTDEKKKYRFMNGLSTKLQERLALNTDGTFPEFVSNAIITDDAIRAHKESKKRKAIAAPSGFAPLNYRMVYALRHTQPPHPHQHQHQQWVFRPHQPQRAPQRALPTPRLCYTCRHH
jgi:hypothetical protein